MAKNCLIYEALNDVKTMEVVKKDNGLMTLSGVFGVCGVRNNNHRVYETSNYTKMVQEMQARIKADGGIPGELEHPQMMNITLENISHKITDINIDENGLVTGTITLLNTPKGKIAQAIVEGGIPLHISSRATGAVDSKTGNVTLERISTYDLVGTPGFSQARLNLNESQIDDLVSKLSTDHSTEIDNTVYAQISESNVFYITEKESEENNQENNINENDMELKEILEKLEALESRVNDLEAENESLREQIDEMEMPEQIDLEKLANGIQKWIVEEYSPKVQEWVVEHYGASNNEDVVAEVTDNAVDEVMNRIAEEVAPKIQEWVVEQYSPEIEKWCVNEFAKGIQTWVLEHYAPEVESWMNESFTTKLTSKVEDMIKESKTNSLSAIDQTLSLLESIQDQKPVYSRKALITENNLEEPKFLREMPADKRVKWDMATEEIKESIMRRAKLYNFINEGAIERFWETINFDTVTPSKSIYEGLESIENERERQIRMKLRSSRFAQNNK